MEKGKLLSWKNKHKVQKAQRLYEEEGLEVIYIAERLGMAIPTVQEWKRKFDWRRKKR